MCIQPLKLVFISASFINKLLSHLLSCTNNLIKVRTPQLLWVHMSFILQVQASSHVGVILFFKLSENKTKKTRLAAPLLFDCRKKIYSKPYFFGLPRWHTLFSWMKYWLVGFVLVVYVYMQLSLWLAHVLFVGMPRFCLFTVIFLFHKLVELHSSAKHELIDDIENRESSALIEIET